MQQPQIDISKTNPIICENEDCKGHFFEEVLMLRKASRILTGTSKDSIIPIPVMRCADCGHINKEFKPNI